MLELSGKGDFSRGELEQLVEVVCTYQYLLILCTFVYDLNNKYIYSPWLWPMTSSVPGTNHDWR